MSLKKKAEVRTGKMVRELMLADKDVTASLIMVYSNNGVNEEIKIEGLNPKSNEELFLSGNVDWNQSVIYKIVDFSGKAEVGKVTVIDMKKNNVTLQIERVMWSKDKDKPEEAEESIEPANKEVAKVQKEEPTIDLIHTANPEKNETLQSVAIQPMAEKEAHTIPAPVTTAKQHVLSPSIQSEPFQPVETALLTPATEHNTTLQESYNRLVAKAVGLCQDYELGMDIDDSVTHLKNELQDQGFKIILDPDILNTIEQLRTLKAKGIDIEKVLNLI